MPLTRRAFVALAPGLVVGSAFARADDLAAACATFEKASGGHVGIHAENLASGRRMTWRPDERFVMCSTFKASLAALVLARVDAGLDRLDRLVSFTADDLQPYAPVARAHLASGVMSVDTLCAAAVELSDNTCANLLLAGSGGPPALTAFWRRLGDATSRLDHDEPELNRTPPGGVEDTTTPRAMAGAVRAVLFGDVLLATSRARLADWMIASKTGADRLRAGLPPQWTVGDKTGNNGKDAFGDLAVAWPGPEGPLVICVYTRGGTPTDEQVKAVFKAVAGIVARDLA